MIALLFCVMASCAVSAEQGSTLLKTVIVSRHGVRTPTIPSDTLDTWTVQPWPRWQEAPGALTARGKTLATLLGRYQREYLSAQNVLASQRCPPRSSVFVYADIEERTTATAQGLVDGIAPGCDVPVSTKGAAATVDSIFHPIAAKICEIDGEHAEAAILARIGGNLERVTSRYQAAFALLQKTLGEVNKAAKAAAK